MKYNLLPKAYHDKFDELENDWTEMSNSKFMSEAQKFESADAKESLKNQKKNEAMKRRRKEEDIQASLIFSQKGKNNNGKRRKTQHQVTNAGKQRFCELCKEAGAPEFLYVSHNTNLCKKKQ